MPQNLKTGLESTVNNERIDAEPVSTNLEEGSLINFKDLKYYHSFSQEKNSWNQWQTQHEQNFAQNGNYTKVLSDLALLPLLNNNCQDVFCWQIISGIEDIPSVFWQGLIGIEDFRFLHHQGVDLRSILRALLADLKEGRMVQGGSTLTQQVVKNLLLENNEKKISRKINELILSLYIELVFSKQEILEIYFNEVFWGGLQGIKIKGVYSASLFYFNKKPRFLNAYEAAILTALLKGPQYYSPVKHIDRLKERADLIFKKLVELNLFSEKVDKPWASKEWKIWEEEIKEREREKPFFAITLVPSLEKSSSLNSYESYVLTRKIYELLGQVKERTKLKDLAVKVIYQKIGSQFSSYEFYSKVERKLDRSMSEEKHQIGSLVKPLAYSVFFDLGKRPNDLVETAEIKLNLISGEWAPKEAHDITEMKVTLEEALLKSFNRPVVRLAQELGFDKVETGLAARIPRLEKPLQEFPAQLLGSSELTLREVMAAYQDVLTHECTVKEERPTVIDILSNPDESTVATNMDELLKGHKYFGKTGTTNLGKDNWYVFFDGQGIGVFWLGIESFAGARDTRLFGSSTAFKIFQNFYIFRGRRYPLLSCDLLVPKAN